jgi:polysaccharide biosynthesis PFTS motif protein
MRGHRRLMQAGRIGSVEAACACLALTPFPIDRRAFSRWFFGAALQDPELVARQYVCSRSALQRLPAEILAQAGGSRRAIVHPLPSAWRELLREMGYPVGGLRSAVLWALWVLLYWCHGVSQLVRLALSTGGRNPLAGKFFSHFEYIGELQLPRPAADGRSHDIVTWYGQWSGKPAEVTGFAYRVKSRTDARHGVAPLTAPVAPGLTLASRLSFVGWMAAAVGSTLLALLRGRWWQPLLLGEAGIARLARTVPPTSLARDYLLNLSGWLYRPMWTYEAEARGSRILFYHYSTNSAVAKRPDGYRPEHHSWKLTNWPEHLVWDEEHRDFVHRAVGALAKVTIVGPIWFASSPDELPPIDRPSVAVFDVQPFRASLKQTSASEFNYYTVENCSAFLTDIARVSAALGVQMVWKRKRDIGKIADPLYRKLVVEMDASGAALVVPSEHSAVRVIENCDIVVSAPFTSTALLGRDLGKPSCYYDPNGAFQRDDRSAHDIPILQGYDELATWVKLHLNR